VIENFRIGSSQQRFGELEFAGGLEMNGSSRHFGALSAIHVFDDQSRMLGVADTGFWYGGASNAMQPGADRAHRCHHAGNVDGERQRMGSGPTPRA
jgi:hypothetical protein